MTNENLLAEIQTIVWEKVARGEADFNEVVRAAVEYFDGEDNEEVLYAAARKVAIAEFAAYENDQRSWGNGPLDSDRLYAAFRSLDTAGIVARADFSCCQNCGVTEIGAEIPKGETRRGYAFCHLQDVDRALHGEGVYLTFGSFSDEIAAKDIATDVVQALTRHGFAPQWNGEVNKRVFVPMTWRDRSQQDWPMTFTELRSALLDFAPVTDNYFSCVSTSGKIVQGMWQAGERLWVEYPDQKVRASFGRFLTMDQALAVLRVFADEDRITLAELGPLTREEWGSKVKI